MQIGDLSTLLVGVATTLLVVIGYLGYRLQRRSSIDPVLKPLTSEEWYKEAQNIHKGYSRVIILAKTPGLLVPSERNLTGFRIGYFETIFERLKQGEW